MNMEDNVLFQLAKEVISTIEERGGEAYMVGGCVRDIVSGKEPQDIDIATSLLPEEVMETFPKVIPVGVEHGTVIVRHGSHSFEVTTYRMEEDYNDYRHPDTVYFVSSIDRDLSRRDFTMNAMALGTDGEIIDPFGGRDAIRRGVIETVGEAEERFEEDPLRMMRALRFAAQLKFSIDEKVITVIRAKKELLTYLSVERIAAEFLKLMCSPSYETGLAYIKKTGVACFLPVIKERPSMIDAIPAVRLDNWGEVISFYHLTDSEFDIRSWTGTWKLSRTTNSLAEAIVWALREYNRGTSMEWIVYNLNGDRTRSFERVMLAMGYDLSRRPTSVYEGLIIKERKELALGADELMEIFPERKKGRWLGESLKELEKIVVERSCSNEKEELIQWITEWDRQKRN